MKTQEEGSPGYLGLVAMLCIAVLARKFAHTVPDLMAYQLLIIQTHWDYKDPAWQRHDKAFRGKVAATENRKLSNLDPHLFHKICAGQARKVGSMPGHCPWRGEQGIPFRVCH